ncbi:hypothetical protein K503DRAFT_775235 [Rhizopogon vinicolor AM-OR11-026]|uniref:Nephrocystin 3-like N-terminal domain-containing protein n=1 Tax=Rhizopogon vinicolor AM-OR11-026 TaxID=1314800 RepID=A0A1B7MME8_9AGAM|nr:hypothetical protein K503DRAFT_775235 [Rhizopogon vinicolor AM-OR11-026]
MAENQFSGHPRSWLSQVAVKGAEFDSRERQPHPKCLRGTRVDLLNYIHGLLDNQEESKLIWLHGTAGVGKSAVAFTVAERMRGLKVSEQTTVEKRLLGTFFFSRKHTQRCTTGYFFATLAYQLVSNFPSVREDLNRTIQDNPGLLHPDKSLYDQLEAFFLQPLRGLRYRLRNCLPPVFAVDALDECTSETEIADLISLLGQALRQPDMPVIHILLTSRSEPHIRNAFQNEEVCPLVCEIPVKTSGGGIATIISLDGTDVDNDICIFLEHSFKELRSRCPDFPPPTRETLMRLASRAGRRFIVASTMMKFIDDEHQDPRARLELMLKLTSNLLPGTEVYKLYDRILSTCANPMRAYQHLSVVASLTDPLPMSQISKLLGPGEGSDVDTALVQLRSIMDIPDDSSLPVQIYHSSARDYACDPLNCSLSELRHNAHPHSLLARSSFRLMMQDMQASRALLDALSALNRHRPAVQSHSSWDLQESLSYIVQPLEPLQVLAGLLWVRGDRSLKFWPDTLDGRAWQQTHQGKCWLQTREGQDWLRTKEELPVEERKLLPTVKFWPQGILRSNDRSQTLRWLQTQGGQDWLLMQEGQEWLQTLRGQSWLQVPGGQSWLQTPRGQSWLQTQGGQGWLLIQGGQEWLQTPGGQSWLQTQGGQDWLLIQGGQEWIQTPGGQTWLQTQGGQDWLLIQKRQEWLQTLRGKSWLQTPRGQSWLQTQGGQGWLLIQGGQEWLLTPGGQSWLQTQGGQGWLLIQGGQGWLQTPGGQSWLQIQGGQDWLLTQGGQEWLWTPGGKSWLQTPEGQSWLQTPGGQASPAASVWLTMEEFSCTLMESRRTVPVVVSESSLLPAFQMIRLFNNLPDFLMFPAFLALRYQVRSTASALSQVPFPSNMEVIHAVKAIIELAKETQEENRSASDALNYACQNWAFHVSQAPKPWDNMLSHLFKSFWNYHLLFWLERQWCLKGLQSCLVLLSEGKRFNSCEEYSPLIDPSNQ